MTGPGLFRWFGAALVVMSAALPRPVRAQSKNVVERERREFADWLGTASVSPRRAIVVRPIGASLSIGPESADIPLRGVALTRLSEKDGRVTLRQNDRTIGLSRGREQTIEDWRFVFSGPAGRAVVTVYGPAPAHPKPLEYYAYDPKQLFVVTLTPAAEARTQRLLAPDGVEVDAGDAGTVAVGIGGANAILRVMRLPGATEDESELEIYFRDATSGHGSYPAGRFVSLIPRSDGRYLLDFNRARNPFCGYNTVYPCPAPWRGNSLTAAIAAGERYAGGGLDAPPQ